MAADFRLSVLLLLLMSVAIARCSDNATTHVAESASASASAGGDDVTKSSTTPATAASSDVEAEACQLTTLNPYVHNTVAQLLKDKASLINYELSFANYSENPLRLTVAGAFEAYKWSRVTTAHGQTLLSLAFNYGILSMMTLTLGTETLHIELVDSPPGCMASIDDRLKLSTVRHLLMRDFDDTAPIATVDEGRICNEIIEDVGGYGRFRHSCCFKNSITGKIDCTTDIGNVWLNLLYGMLTVVRFGLLCFGPALFISAVESMSKQEVPYVVKMKEPLKKTVLFRLSETKVASNVRAKRVLDLRSMKAFPKLRNLTREQALLGRPVKVAFSQYDINVDYRRMLKENTVPVGLFRSLFDQIFKCEIRHVGPFRDCCKTNMMFPAGGDRALQWTKCFKKVSRAVLILLVPFPFYLRLAIFYVYEYGELQKRKQAIATNGLTEPFENSIIHYFTPTHGIFIFIYIIYAITAVALAFLSRKGKEHRMKKIIVESFRDLKRLNWTDSLSMAVANVIWPFKRFGMLGCLVGLVYWPFVVPLTLVVSLSYFIPTIYLTIRMAFHSKMAILVKGRRSKRKSYKVRIDLDQDMHKFEMDKVVSCGSRKERADEEVMSDPGLDDIDHVKPPEHIKDMSDKVSLASSIITFPSFSIRRLIKYGLCAVLCILALYCIVFILSEVIGCLVEIVVFTIMGVIVNAASLLKYVTLVLMIFVYCCDCFNNMAKKYLKMNKALFNEVKCRCKDLEKVTSLPSFLQENRGFKSQELNEQADYESPDDVAVKPVRHWMINDLVLFVDSEDTPRIPRQLFDEVCNIRVAGVPGPVFRGHLEALAQLAKIVIFILFVFIVVLSFGAVYKVSSTNQMLATMLGGFLPMVLRTFLAPPAPDVEIGTVSFKSKMDEVIKNFCQYWPIYDLPFEVVKDEEPAVEGNDASAAAREPPKTPKSPASPSNCRPMIEQAFMTVTDEFGIPFLSALAREPENNNDEVDQPQQQDDEMEMKPVTSKSVRIRVPEPVDEVDLLVHLPQIDLQWLDVWSDYGSVDDIKVDLGR